MQTFREYPRETHHVRIRITLCTLHILLTLVNIQLLAQGVIHMGHTHGELGAMERT